MRTAPPSQLPFDLTLPARYGAEDYVVGEANRKAWELVSLWPRWPSQEAQIIGPAGAGKSHLAALWAANSDAVRLTAADLPAIDPVAVVARGPIVVEDLGPGLDETALFHLMNATRAAGRSLLLTARTPPAAWDLRLPDLASRLRAATPVFLEEPDDALLEALLGKLFADRQITVAPQVISYLALRMDRSYDAAAGLVAALDRVALAEGRPIGRAVAQRVLAEGWSREPELPGLDDDTTDNPS